MTAASDTSGVGDEHALDLGGIHVDTAGDDDVLLAVDQEEKPFSSR